jgi:hypothetical protein
MSVQEEPDLRAAFAALRNAERAAAPAYQAVLAAGSGRPRKARPTVLVWVALAVAAVLVGVAGRWAAQAVAASYAAAQMAQALGPFGGARWRSPTDPLLQTPGYDLLVAVPSITTPDSLSLGLHAVSTQGVLP